MKIANKIKIFLITTILFICFNKNYAITQKEAGEIIAQFAINFFDNYASETVYSVKGWADNVNGQRAYAYRGQKTSGEAEPSDGMKSRGMTSINYTNKYSMDCVGFVSFCIHQALKLGDNNTFTCFVTPQSGGSNGFEKVTDGSRKPGDILATSGHVAVYIGNGEIIDSAAAGPDRAISRRATANKYPSTYRISNSTAAGINKENTTVQFEGKGSSDYSFSDVDSGSSTGTVSQILSGTPPEHWTSGCKDFSGYFSWTNVTYTSSDSGMDTSGPTTESNTTVTIPANIDPEQWIYPLVSRHTADPTTGSRFFGASRDEGKRAHAGMDLIVSPGVQVIAMTDGTVIQSYNFYQNTDAVEVQNDDGSIVRYTEISVSVSAGKKIKKGDVLGKVIANRDGSSMLHIEVYDGSGSGALTQKSNTTYKNVSAKNYQRRSDLLDPTFVKDLPMATVQ